MILKNGFCELSTEKADRTRQIKAEKDRERKHAGNMVETCQSDMRHHETLDSLDNVERQGTFQGDDNAKKLLEATDPCRWSDVKGCHGVPQKSRGNRKIRKAEKDTESSDKKSFAESKE